MEPSSHTAARLKYHKQRIEDLGNRWREVTDHIALLEAEKAKLEEWVAKHGEKISQLES